jgi:hypothetical protein
MRAARRIQIEILANNESEFDRSTGKLSDWNCVIKRDLATSQFPWIVPEREELLYEIAPRHMCYSL